MTSVHVHERLHRFSYNRLSEHRQDETWTTNHWADPASRVMVIVDRQIVVTNSGVLWAAPNDVPDPLTSNRVHRILLGEWDGVARFAVVCDADVELPDALATYERVYLRSMLAVLPDNPDSAFVLHAIGIAEWLAATKFCPRCGNSLDVRKEGHELVCKEGHISFPRTDPAVIMIVTNGEPGAQDERALLARNPAWPPGRYSTLAGFCEPGETLEDSVRREVGEEVGVWIDGEVTYFGNQPWPLPASLMLGFFGRTTNTELNLDPQEIAEAAWFTRDELKAAVESGEVRVPGGVSISQSLINHWYGGELPSGW